MPTMLVLGAGSRIARAAVREFAAAGWDFQLAGRDMGALEAVAAALPAGAPCFLFDAEDEVSRAGLWPSLPTPPDALLCAVGRLGDQARARTDYAYARALVECNFTGLIPILGQAAADFEARGSGLIIG
ncbi:MAG: SDR family NAD(P)-dependent oxidoreductase [Bilophila sp.]